MKKNNSKPILFSTEMVQAILDGRKTMTRRIVKFGFDQKDFSFIKIMQNTDNQIGTHAFFNGDQITATIKCPYGNIGDELWVRETWQQRSEKAMQLGFEKYYYKAGWEGCTDGGWKPSIFMPREASRITLEITDIRVERLQSISNKDAKAEGAAVNLTLKDFDLLKGLEWVIPRPFLEHQFGFLALWSRINGIDSWQENPWVWVIEFNVKEVGDEE
ncbi:hypothetical protein [Emticicia sp.]|uniref:hypothetical protein n=1 Tax=Emticicia sp. TaxID=1930953 RepID=UPI0037512E26